MPIDHLALGTTPELFDSMLNLYLAALKPLGYEKLIEPKPQVVGLGKENAFRDFWIAVSEGAEVQAKGPHFAFKADNRELVDQAYKAAIEAGGKDNGAPGLRQWYHPNYYAAFFVDQMGNRAEIVCHTPA